MDDLLIKYILGNCTETEILQVKEWLAESENKRYFDQISDIYLLGKATREPSGFDREKSLARIKSSYYKQKYFELKDDRKTIIKRHKLNAIISVAASVLLIVSVGFNLRQVFSPGKLTGMQNTAAYNEITAPKGSRTQIVMPDGTKVWLNAGSKIRFPMDFLAGDRHVSLMGEAYFDVVKSNKKRFIVNTSDLAIKVWGTKFDVKAYPDERTIQTTLVEGSISIQKLKGRWFEKETYLSPNQMAIYYKTKVKETPDDEVAKNTPLKKVIPQSMLIQNEIKTILYTSWKDKKWVIDGQTLGDLATELERRFNVEIRFENESLKRYRFTGILSEETFDQVLEVIKFSAPVDFTVLNNQVTFKENKNSKSSYDKFLKH